MDLHFEVVYYAWLVTVELVCCAWLAAVCFIWLKVSYHGAQARLFHWRLQALNVLILSSFMVGIVLLSHTGIGAKAIGTALLGAVIVFGYLEQKLWRQATEY